MKHSISNTVMTLAIFLSLYSPMAHSDTTVVGYVTPAQLTMTITGIALIDTSTTSSWVMPQGQSVSVTWSASDTDFTPTSFASLSIPEGRYIGAQVSFSTDRTVLLSGYKYQGTSSSSSSGGQDGNYVCSNSTGWTYQSSSSCTSPTSLKFAMTTDSAKTYFQTPICVATPDRKANLCPDSDTYLDASSADNLKLYVLMDLYNSVKISADSTTYDSSNDTFSGITLNNAPYVVFGTLGPAMHLSYHINGSNNVADISLFFDSNKKLIYGNSYATSNTVSAGTLTGVCTGTAGAKALGAPTGSFLNTLGTSIVSSYNTKNGKAAIHMDEGIGTGGMNLFSDLRQSAGTQISMSCLADSSSSITSWDSTFSTYLGWTYILGPGNAITTSGVTGSTGVVMKVGKIVDSNGVLGITGCGKTESTSCGSYP